MEGKGNKVRFFGIAFRKAIGRTLTLALTTFGQRTMDLRKHRG